MTSKGDMLRNVPFRTMNMKIMLSFISGLLLYHICWNLCILRTCSIIQTSPRKDCEEGIMEGAKELLKDIQEKQVSQIQKINQVQDMINLLNKGSMDQQVQRDTKRASNDYGRMNNGVEHALLDILIFSRELSAELDIIKASVSELCAKNKLNFGQILFEKDRKNETVKTTPKSEEEKKQEEIKKVEVAKAKGSYDDDGVALWTVGAGTIKTTKGNCKVHDSSGDPTGTFCGCNTSEVEARKWKNNLYIHPCCMDRVRDMFRAFDEEMDKRELRYLLDGGTVIGWWRNRNFVPYDPDVDITVRLDVWTSPLFKEVLAVLVDKHGFCLLWLNKFHIRFRNHGFEMEIFLMMIEKGVAHVSWNPKFCSKCTHPTPPQPMTNLFPEQLTVFEGIETWVPHNVNAYLDGYFGKDKWQQPRLPDMYNRQQMCNDTKSCYGFKEEPGYCLTATGKDMQNKPFKGVFAALDCLAKCKNMKVYTCEFHPMHGHCSTGDGVKGSGTQGYTCWVKGSVSCGHHRAPTCPECPEGHGASWCNGQCKWSNQTQTCQQKG